MRILLAVPSDSVSSVLEALLTARGIEVVSETNAARVLELCAEAEPDAVVVAVDVAGAHDGVEVCRLLKGRSARLPVIVIGPSSDEDVRARALEAGATGYYGVPVSPTALVKELESIRPRP